MSDDEHCNSHILQTGQQIDIELKSLTSETKTSSKSHGNLNGLVVLVKNLGNKINNTLSTENFSHRDSTPVVTNEPSPYFSPMTEQISDQNNSQRDSKHDSKHNSEHDSKHNSEHDSERDSKHDSYSDITNCHSSHENSYTNNVDIETGHNTEHYFPNSPLQSLHINDDHFLNDNSRISVNSNGNNLENCEQVKQRKNILKGIIHYYTHFLMFIIFEILFYFKYVVEYEKKLVYKMISRLMQDIVNYTPIDISKYKKCDFYSQICKTFVDNKTSKANTSIYENALYLICGMSAFLIFLIVIETNMFKQKSTFPKEFGKSLLLMIFVGAFDYLFFNFFILKYKIIDTGELMCYLYEHNNIECQNINSTTSFLLNHH